MIVKLIRRLVGIDAVDYWRQRHEGTLALLADHNAKAGEALSQKQSELTVWREKATHHQEDAHRAAAELAALRRQLVFEQTARGLYEQIVIEAAEQIGKNSEVAPKTLMGVLRVSFTEAVATVEAWRQGAPVEGPMATNLRATMANRLLPDPVQSCARCAHPLRVHENNAGSCLRIECQCQVAVVITKAERKRDGKAGDSAHHPSPIVPHTYEYPFGSMSSEHCAVPGCGLPYDNFIHATGGWSRP